MGVDRLAFSFPVGRHAPWSSWDKVSFSSGGGRSLAVKLRPYEGGPGVDVFATSVAGKLWGKVECNPARLLDPEGCSLLPPRLIPGAVETMWAAACEVLTPDCGVADSQLTRADPAVDFRGVTSPALYVEGLERLKRAYARRQFRYRDPQRGSAETLFVGSNAGGVRLYDQHQAYAEKGAPFGSLRWEVEAHKPWLRHAGVRYVGDLDVMPTDVVLG